MLKLFFQSLPFNKAHVALALEAGVDALIVPEDKIAFAASLARGEVFGPGAFRELTLRSKSDELVAAQSLENGEQVILRRGWEVIPVENLLALPGKKNGAMLILEAAGLAEAGLALGILERGADGLLMDRRALDQLPGIVELAKYSPGRLDLRVALITEVRPAGLGHRVCVDTTSLLRPGQGMLVGNSAAFTFLVQAECESNEYVASRPFRVNAGAVHAYALMPGDRTSYLVELKAGDEALMADSEGRLTLAAIGRVKVERRPMLLVRARTENGLEGAVFLQNAETIRLVRPGGASVSVVELKEGDAVLCRPDSAGRHFGMRISEDIKEG